MKELVIKIEKLLEYARIFGLEARYLAIAKDFLAHREYGLCFDTIIEQMYESDIPITISFYKLVAEIGILLEIPSDNYIFIKELIPGDAGKAGAADCIE